MIPVSVLLLAQDSEKVISPCLESLRPLAEVVVVDGGSQDETVAVAKSYPNVRVFSNPWPGFVEQRNFSLSKASYPWCLMVDSDEVVSPQLLAEIKKWVEQGLEFPAYKIKRTEFYLGLPIEKGQGRSRYHLRLFQRERVRYEGGVHHRHLIDGHDESQAKDKIGLFPDSCRIEHDRCYGLKDWVQKLPRFSGLVAQEKYERGKRPSAFAIWGAFFFYSLKALLGSARYGRVGIVIALQTGIYQALTRLILYEKATIHFDDNAPEKSGKAAVAPARDKENQQTEILS